MPVIIIHNFDVANGIVNGCMGTLKSVHWSMDDNGDHHAHSCVIESADAMDEPLPNL